MDQKIDRRSGEAFQLSPLFMYFGLSPKGQDREYNWLKWASSGGARLQRSSVIREELYSSVSRPVEVVQASGLDASPRRCFGNVHMGGDPRPRTHWNAISQMTRNPFRIPLRSW